MHQSGKTSWPISSLLHRKSHNNNFRSVCPDFHMRSPAIPSFYRTCFAHCWLALGNDCVFTVRQKPRRVRQPTAIYKTIFKLTSYSLTPPKQLEIGTAQKKIPPWSTWSFKPFSIQVFGGQGLAEGLCGRCFPASRQRWSATGVHFAHRSPRLAVWNLQDKPKTGEPRKLRAKTTLRGQANRMLCNLLLCRDQQMTTQWKTFFILKHFQICLSCLQKRDFISCWLLVKLYISVNNQLSRCDWWWGNYGIKKITWRWGKIPQKVEKQRLQEKIRLSSVVVAVKTSCSV